jgi:hypothetical protein
MTPQSPTVFEMPAWQRIETAHVPETGTLAPRRPLGLPDG